MMPMAVFTKFKKRRIVNLLHEWESKQNSVVKTRKHFLIKFETCTVAVKLEYKLVNVNKLKSLMERKVVI